MLTLKDAQRRLRLVDRAVKRGQGKLPASSALPHSVALGVHMVGIEKLEGDRYKPNLSYPLFLVVERNIEGPHEIWFDQDGNASISFATDDDATVFKLAMDVASS
ncbi:hypothetical protein [Sphingomonas aracearum]|uniref:Uncharacterized protein n=1 Tax=Sphingomonas aracearum TaxID=2283317 RepID=A0A369VYU4_9SPHN|nr:hypothetical protein [Sphingomonas aracearum]RDE06795.1 hypothetical protein DVW87_03675 [Sphingomonas aracearum]